MKVKLTCSICNRSFDQPIGAFNTEDIKITNKGIEISFFGAVACYVCYPPTGVIIIRKQEKL